jgi:outer membrane protein assembly factor BamB
VFSTPTVAGDLLFIGSCAGTFYAINKTTGQVQWSYDIRKDGKQQSFHGDPLVTGDLILVGTDRSCDPEGVGHVYAFDRNSGKVRWKYRSTSVPTDIVQLGSNLYFGSFQDRWSSITLQSGALNWNFSTDTPNPDCDPVKSPVGHDNRLFLSGLDGVVYALDAKTGRMTWKRKLAAPPSTSLALRNKILYVGTSDNHVYSLSAETGNVVAELAVEAPPVGRLSFDADSMFMFMENRSERAGYVIALDPKLAGVRWMQKSSREWTSERPHVWKGLIIAGNCRGEVASFRASDGAPQWTLQVKGCIRSIGSYGNLLFIGVQEGTIYAFDLNGQT